jgi:hypothetical protein
MRSYQCCRNGPAGQDQLGSDEEVVGTIFAERFRVADRECDANDERAE